MKKLFLVLFVGLILPFQLQAKRIEGKILLENDTVNVVFEIPYNLFSQEPNYKKLQYKVRYFDSIGLKKTLKPGEAREIRFIHNNVKIRMLSRPNSLAIEDVYSFKSNIFLKLELDGVLKLFSYYTSNSIPGVYNSSSGTTGTYTENIEKFVLQKGNGELKQPKSLSFRKDMADYLKDCPDLSHKIENQEFGKKDMSAIVIYYNANCTN